MPSFSGYLYISGLQVVSAYLYEHLSQFTMAKQEGAKRRRVQKGKKGPKVGMSALYLSHDGAVPKAFLGD